MTRAREADRPLLRSRSLRLVLWMSLAYLALSAFGTITAVVTLVTHLLSRSAGIPWVWDPGLPTPQPTGVSISGAPYVPPGTSAYITQMTGTVSHLPAATIVLTGAGDIVASLTGAGIAVCVLVLAHRVSAGAPFARASVSLLFWLAGIVLVGFEASILLHALAVGVTPGIVVTRPAVPDGFWRSPGTSVAVVSAWPVYAAAAIAALAAIFRVGVSYQEDSEGLV